MKYSNKNTPKSLSPAEQGEMASRMERHSNNSKKSKRKTNSVKSKLIPNNYKGKTPEQVWNGWDQGQRFHFMQDHRHELTDAIQDDFKDYVTDKYRDIEESIKAAIKKHMSKGQYKDGGLVLYNPDDLAKFWNDEKNKDKTIFFVEEMEGEDDDGNPESYFVVGNQTLKDYRNSHYWDFDGNYETTGEAVTAANKQAKKTKGGVYAKNLRLIRGFENGGFTAGAKNIWSKTKSAASSAYEKAKPAAKSAYEKGKKATKEAYDKTKIAVKKKLHDQKKKVAIEVISEMEDKSTNPKDKETLEESMNIVWDKYEAGGKMPPRSKIIEHFQEAIDTYYDNGMNNFRGQADMEKMFKKDKRDLQLILELYSNGKKNEALHRAEHLDTAVRDEIPSIVWKSMGADLYPSGQAELDRQLKKYSKTKELKDGGKASHKSIKSKLSEGGGKYKQVGKISGLKAVEVAEELSPLQFEGYDAVKLQAFPTDNMDKQRDLYQYILKKLNSKFKKYKGKLTKDVYDELENENYHVLNSILAYNGWFDESVPSAWKKGTGYFDEEAVKMESGGSMANDGIVEKVKNLLRKNKVNADDVSPNFVNDFAHKHGIGDLTSKQVVEISDTYESSGSSMANGGISPKKARMILHEGKAHGKDITDKQRRFFGARASGYPVKRSEDGGKITTQQYENIANQIKKFNTSGRDPFNWSLEYYIEEPDDDFEATSMSSIQSEMSDNKEVVNELLHEVSKMVAQGKTSGKLLVGKNKLDATWELTTINKKEDGGTYENGGKTENLEDIAQEVYLKFLDRCKEYFENDPLIESINKEYELVSTNDPDGIKHAMKYYQDKTSHKADIFKNAGADELSKAFIKASRNAEDINFPLK